MRLFFTRERNIQRDDNAKCIEVGILYQIVLLILNIISFVLLNTMVTRQTRRLEVLKCKYTF